MNLVLFFKQTNAFENNIMASNLKIKQSQKCSL